MEADEEKLEKKKPGAKIVKSPEAGLRDTLLCVLWLVSNGETWKLSGSSREPWGWCTERRGDGKTRSMAGESRCDNEEAVNRAVDRGNKAPRKSFGKLALTGLAEDSTLGKEPQGERRCSSTLARSGATG